MTTKNKNKKYKVIKTDKSIIVKQEKINWKDRFAEFWIDVGVKLVRIAISVKVWGLIGIPALSTWLLMESYIDPESWTTINTTTISVIYGMREIFKVGHIGGESDSDIADMIGGEDVEYFEMNKPCHNRRRTDDRRGSTDSEEDIYGGNENFDNYEVPKL